MVSLMATRSWFHIIYKFLYLTQVSITNRAQYIAAAKDAYNQRMIDAHTGAANFPKVRTFGKANESSTNSIFADLQGAADT